MWSKCFILCLITCVICVSVNENLKVIHVLFRHGNRTSDLKERYPLDPFVNETYFPFGAGQLTTIGKRKEFSIGQYLRKRYGDFLGDYYYPEIIEAISTDYNRTKASLELVLAGLFPPVKEEIWNDQLLWQPIPYNYEDKYSDKILLGTYCPNYIKLENEYLNSEDVLKDLKKHEDIFKYVSENTGLNVTNYGNIYDLYFGLSTEEEWGFTLPQWTKSVWPDTLTKIAIKEYDVYMGNLEMKRINAGYLLQKIIRDTEEVLKNTESKRKVYLYSAHENNVAQLLMALDIFDNPHIPTYGSFVIIEIHHEKENYIVKVIYQNYSTENPRELRLHCGKNYCSFEDFKRSVSELMPKKNSCSG